MINQYLNKKTSTKREETFKKKKALNIISIREIEWIDTE